MHCVQPKITSFIFFALGTPSLHTTTGTWGRETLSTEMEPGAQKIGINGKQADNTACEAIVEAIF